MYQNVCLGDRKFLFSAGSLSQDYERQLRQGEPIDDYQNFPAFGTGSVMDIRHRILPHRSFLPIELAEMNASALSILAEKPIDLAFVTGFDSHNDNLFHFAESALFYHAVQQWNGTVLDMHPLTMALLDRPRPTQGSWIHDFATILFAEKEHVPLLGRSDTLQQTYENGIPLCFRQLIVGGTIIHLILGPRDAEHLKAKVYRMLQVSSNPRPDQLPRRILVEIHAAAKLDKSTRNCGYPRGDQSSV